MTVARPPVDVDLLAQAVKVLVTASVGSVEIVRQELAIPRDQALAILEELERRGVVGPAQGEAARAVLVPPDRLPAVLAALRQPAGAAPGAELAVRPDAPVAGTAPPAVKPAKPDRPHLVGRVVRRPAQAVVALRQSERAKRNAKVLVVTPVRVTARVGWTTYQGGSSWVRRAQRAATHAVAREQVAAAHASRNREEIAKALQQLKDLKDARVRRLKELPKVIGACIAVAVIAAVAVLALLLVGGIGAWAFRDGLTWSDWWSGVATVLDAIGTVLRWVFVLTLCGVALVVPVAMWREGVRAGRPFRWMVTKVEQAQMDSRIDERMISRALAHLGNSALNQFFKEGGVLRYPDLPRQDGEGTYAKIDLPLGVTAEEIAAPKVRARLAGNLRRSSLECWPTKGDEDGVLELWVADKGKLNGGVGPWPLLHDGVVDAFEGVPLGRSQRGQTIIAPLFENNWLIGGRPGQGKSACMRCLMLGAALDPTAELWAFVLGESPDFAPFRPRLTRYAMGLDEDVFEQAIQALRDLLAEMERRGKVLGEQPGTPPRTSRRLANRPALGLHLLVAAFDEVHELFMHPRYGKEAAELAVRLIRRGRKYGIVLIFATQAPTAESIPRDVTRQISCGVAFSVQDHVANDGLLGTGKFKAGIRATELRMNVDRGTCVTVGITENAFELIRTFYVPFGDGVDEVTPVVARAMAGIKELRRTDRPSVKPEPAKRDFLRDVREALRGEPRVRTAVLLGRLIEIDAGEYEPWGFQELSAALADEGVPIGKHAGQSVVRLRDVAAALARRDDGEDDDA